MLKIFNNLEKSDFKTVLQDVVQFKTNHAEKMIAQKEQFEQNLSDIARYTQAMVDGQGRGAENATVSFEEMAAFAEKSNGTSLDSLLHADLSAREEVIARAIYGNDYLAEKIDQLKLKNEELQQVVVSDGKWFQLQMKIIDKVMEVKFPGLYDRLDSSFFTPEDSCYVTETGPNFLNDLTSAIKAIQENINKSRNLADQLTALW